MLLSDVCLSVAYIGPNSRTERPRKTKIGIGVAHITRDSDTTFKVKGQRSTCLMGIKGIACAHILLCFGLLWQCRHKLGKIAQSLFFVLLLLFLLAISVVNCSLWRFSYLQLIRLAGDRGGGILCRHAHSLVLFCTSHHLDHAHYGMRNLYVKCEGHSFSHCGVMKKS